MKIRVIFPQYLSAIGCCLVILLLVASHANASEPVELKSTAAVIVPAKIIKQAPEKYPDNMRKWGNEGDGILDYTLTDIAVVRDIKVIKSPHPSFEYVMVQMLLGSKIAPSTRDGVPTTVRVRLPFKFRLLAQRKEPSRESPEAFKFPAKSGDSMPEAYRYDEPPKINVAVGVVYPRQMLIDEKRGNAKVAVMLDSTGVVQDVKVVEASHPEFGEATKAMMYAWEFAPAKNDGKPVPAIFTYKQIFDRTNRDTWFTDETERTLAAATGGKSSVVEFPALDKPPVARYRPNPVDPRVVNAPAEKVVIGFYIDEEGGVQLPAIVTGTNTELGWAAMTAIKRWVFDALTVNGKPAMLYREMEFAFR